jgi:citrate synthase
VKVAEDWLTAAEAAQALGVTLPTLYAYASRGLIDSHPVPEARRRSRYARRDVERLRTRAQHRSGNSDGLTVVIDTALTLLDPAGHLYYRGWDATEACREASYERVAEWLWTGADDGEPATWDASSVSRDTIRAATAALPSTATSVERLRVGAAVAVTADPMRDDRRPSAIVMTGRSLIATLVDSLPDCASPGASDMRAPRLRVADGTSRGHSIAARLWPKVCARRPRRSDIAVLNAALVLWADHELAASTLAARVAASTWANPYLTIQAGLAALGGPLHGGGTDAARQLIAEVAAGRPAAEAVGARLTSEVGVPGVGHAVYQDVDPRAAALMSILEDTHPAPRVWRAVQDVLAVIRERDLPAINIDFAAGAMCTCLGLEPAAGETTFAVARCAGWLAHAGEEYAHRLRFRPRAAYIGSPPRSRKGQVR